MANNLIKIYRSKKTVFSANDLAILLSETNENNLKAKISYYVKKKYLIRLRRGFYAKSEEYEQRELATKIYTPSYVSFETVLADEGVIFQYYATISVASYLSRDFKTFDVPVSCRKLKQCVLLNRAGIENKGSYYQATKERAFLDTVYLQGDIYFDNLRGMDWEKCLELVKIYRNKSLEKKLKSYIKDFKEDDQ